MYLCSRKQFVTQRLSDRLKGPSCREGQITKKRVHIKYHEKCFISTHSLAYVGGDVVQYGFDKL